jgi:translation initiation factor 5
MDFTNEIYLASNEHSLNDPSYRYKMKPLIIKVTGRQDNWTTCFINSEDIAEKIKRPNDFFGKYIGYALSCPTKQDKELKCLTFKGNYTNEVITRHFMEFVKIYVLCPKCDLPETKLFIQKSEELPKGLSHNCEACGNISLVKPKSFDKTFEFIEKNTK